MGGGASASAGAMVEEQTKADTWLVEGNGPQGQLLLSVTRESLDLCAAPGHEQTGPVLHYPYYKIKCWSSTPSTFSFQLGVESVQKTLRFKTMQGALIQKKLLATILHFMDQSKDNALQPADFKVFRDLMFYEKKQLVGNWQEVAEEYFTTRAFRLTAAHSIDLLAEIDHSDEFVALDFCCMLHQYILNEDSFKLVMNSIGDKQLKLNLASRLGIDNTASEGVTVKAPNDSDSG